MTDRYDLIILGSGSTAFAAALKAADHGARVAMFEKSVLGGTCVNWGCIPSKTLIHDALFRHEAEAGRNVGSMPDEGLQPIDAEQLYRHRESVVSKLRKERYLDVLGGMNGLDLFKGTARFVDPRTIECDERRFRSERILIAVGGTPRIPPVPGLETCDYMTSRSALLSKDIPESLVVMGGGVIAVELGQMYQRLGSRVTILEHGPRLLPMVEPELSAVLERIFIREHITVVTGSTVSSVERVDNRNLVHTEVDGVRHAFSCDRLLLAVGTVPATGGIGLERAGVATDQRGFIITDRRMRTSAEGIWAAGDVVGRMMIATVGAREGIVAVEDMFNPACRCTMDYLGAPMAIFTDPEAAMVGYTQGTAALEGIDHSVNCMPVSAIPKAHVTGAPDGVIKMIAERPSGRLLGVHLLCHRGADMINEASLALRMGATVSDIASTMHVYPSIGEGLRLCAQGFYRDINRLSCCAE